MGFERRNQSLILERQAKAFVKCERGESLYDAEVINDFTVEDTNSGHHYPRRFRKMSKEFAKAEEITLEARESFSKALNEMMFAEKQLGDGVKRVAGQIKKAQHDLGNSLEKVEKAANFDRLERYTALLERSAAAMSTLAAIEESGKLDRIAEALR